MILALMTTWRAVALVGARPLPRPGRGPRPRDPRSAAPAPARRAAAITSVTKDRPRRAVPVPRSRIRPRWGWNSSSADKTSSSAKGPAQASESLEKTRHEGPCATLWSRKFSSTINSLGPQGPGAFILPSSPPRPPPRSVAISAHGRTTVSRSTKSDAARDDPRSVAPSADISGNSDEPRQPHPDGAQDCSRPAISAETRAT